jgi:hypothetical protein
MVFVILKEESVWETSSVGVSAVSLSFFLTDARVAVADTAGHGEL